MALDGDIVLRDPGHEISDRTLERHGSLRRLLIGFVMRVVKQELDRVWRSGTLHDILRRAVCEVTKKILQLI